MKFYVCQNCGCGDFDPGPCWACGGPTFAETRGAPPPDNTGTPFVVKEKIRKYFDFALGCEVTSRSEFLRKLKDRGLHQVSVGEHRREHPTNVPRKLGASYHYAGQSHHGDRRSQFE